MLNLEGEFGPPLSFGEEDGNALSGKLTRDPSAMSGGSLQDGGVSGVLPGVKGGEALTTGGPSAQRAGGLRRLLPAAAAAAAAAVEAAAAGHGAGAADITNTYRACCYNAAAAAANSSTAALAKLHFLLSTRGGTQAEGGILKLVGLSWQHRVAADGEAQWVFQKAPLLRLLIRGALVKQEAERRIGTLQSAAVSPPVFRVQQQTSCCTIAFFLMASIGLALSGTNLLAYYKCARSQSPQDVALASLQAATWRHVVLSRLGLA
ncbi:hypothetical protein ACSSS7_004287 [Eimeria intestinalis]